MLSDVQVQSVAVLKFWCTKFSFIYCWLLIVIEQRPVIMAPKFRWHFFHFSSSTSAINNRSVSMIYFPCCWSSLADSICVNRWHFIAHVQIVCKQFRGKSNDIRCFFLIQCSRSYCQCRCQPLTKRSPWTTCKLHCEWFHNLITNVQWSIAIWYCPVMQYKTAK